jgi:hypothetical protein
MISTMVPHSTIEKNRDALNVVRKYLRMLCMGYVDKFIADF